MKVLDLFAGTRSVSKAFEELGWESYSVELDETHPNISLYKDIMTLTANEILENFGQPDVIWASPPCTSYSIMGISHHRVKNWETGELDPVSDFAKFSDRLLPYVLELIKELNPRYYFIENPRGGLRKMKFMQDLPRHSVTYCQYGDFRMKPTDIWTNHENPQFKPMCKNGAPCHESSPRGSTLRKLGIKERGGTQGMKNARERSKIPHELCLHVAKVCEEGLKLGKNDERTTVLS